MLRIPSALISSARTERECRSCKPFSFPAVALPNQIADVFKMVSCGCPPSSEESFNPQFRVDLPLDLVDGSKQLFKTTAAGKVCCLNRYQHIVGSCQRIDGQHTQRRHTVKKNVIIILFDCIQVIPENGFPAHGISRVLPPIPEVRCWTAPSTPSG